MFDIDQWKFINTFAPWLSALGTICAVMLSLHLARRDKSVRLEITAGHRIMVTPGQRAPHPEYLLIKVVNVGHREAQIVNIGWKVGWYRWPGNTLRLQLAVQTLNRDGMSSEMPIRLKDGEDANYFIPLNDDTKWIESMAADFLPPSPAIRSRLIEVQVFTSIGKTFGAKIEEGLRKKILASMHTPTGK